MKRVLIVDNYDSFTYNLVQLFGELGAEVVVRRNDAVTGADADRIDPTHVVISPGPGHPESSGASLDMIRRYAGKRPLLGVCLGHQAIGLLNGAEVAPAPSPRHGKTSMIYHDGRGLFLGLPNPFRATRYHSLVVREQGLPASLEISAYTSEGEIMGLRVKGTQVEGTQFHPESIMTDSGRELVRNFLEMESAQ